MYKQNTSIDIDICHWMLPLQKLYSMTLTYISWSNISNANISKTVRARAEMHDTTFILVFAIEWRHCESCTPWLWPTFSRSNISNADISEIVRSIWKLCHTALIDFDIWHVMAPLQLLYSITLTYFFKIKYLKFNLGNCKS